MLTIYLYVETWQKIKMASIKEIRPLEESDLTDLQAWISAENWTAVTVCELKEWRALYPESFIGAYNDNDELLGEFLFSLNLIEETGFSVSMYPLYRTRDLLIIIRKKSFILLWFTFCVTNFD